MALTAQEYAQLRRAVLCELKDEANMVTTPDEDLAHKHFNGVYTGPHAEERRRLYKLAARAVANAARRR